MKIRNGFVSNSSSSSFILVGKEYTYKDCVEDPVTYDLVPKELVGKPRVAGFETLGSSGYEVWAGFCLPGDPECISSIGFAELNDIWAKAMSVLGPDCKLFYGTRYH